MMTPKGKRGWGNSVVLGTVTNNNDPDKLGRVRVKYPALGDDTESPWARGRGAERGQGAGLLMTPQVGDEVVIGFEHDDVHQPYVLGSLWNGKAKPGDDLSDPGRRRSRCQSDQKIAMHAKDAITIKSRQGPDRRDAREDRGEVGGRDVAEAEREHDDRGQPGRHDQGRHRRSRSRADQPRDQVRHGEDHPDRGGDDLHLRTQISLG